MWCHTPWSPNSMVQYSWHQVGGSCYRSHVDRVPWYHMVPTFITKGLYVTNLLIKLRNWSVWDKAWLDETSLFWFYHQRAISSKTNGKQTHTGPWVICSDRDQLKKISKYLSSFCFLKVATNHHLPLIHLWVDSCIVKQPLSFVKQPMSHGDAPWFKKEKHVSKNRGTTKSWILIGFSIINHPFWGTPTFGNTHISPHEENKVDVIAIARSTSTSVFWHRTVVVCVKVNL